VFQQLQKQAILLKINYKDEKSIEGLNGIGFSDKIGTGCSTRVYFTKCLFFSGVQ
jgi:hypothetical protein